MNVLIRSRSRTGVSFSLDERYSAEMAMSYPSVVVSSLYGGMTRVDSEGQHR